VVVTPTLGVVSAHERARRALQPSAALVAAAVPILAGTDAPNPPSEHGTSLHRELELLVEAGMSPLQRWLRRPRRPLGLSA